MLPPRLVTSDIVCYVHSPSFFFLYKVRFALTSAQIFSRTDLLTDSERFYNSILEVLDDPEEKDKVDQLLIWWNRYSGVLVLLHIF